MKDILSGAQRHVLDEFVSSNVLLAFDYDGTLAPIVSDPDRAEMRKRTRGLLEELVEVYPVVVISGRAHADVLRRVRGLNLAGVVGNHGIERWHTAGTQVAEVEAWRQALQAALAPLKGVTIEDKIYSIAVHYRRSRERKVARAEILKAAAALGDVRVIGGKQVVNILPKGAPHKGIALERERDRLGCDTALYVGDDETDEDVFALDQPGRLLTIRVGPKRSSAASYCILDQRVLDRLLRALIEIRSRQARPRRAVQ